VEAIANQKARAREWDERSRQQLAKRDERDRELLMPPSQTREETNAEMAARGMSIDERPLPVVEAEALKAKYGVTAAQWDEIPDLPGSHEDRAAAARADHRLPFGDAKQAAADLAARKAGKAVVAKDEKPLKPLANAADVIEREYAAHGIEPVMAGSVLVSPSLLKNLGKWPVIAPWTAEGQP
jgi:hypothetical protein